MTWAPADIRTAPHCRCCHFRHCRRRCGRPGFYRVWVTESTLADWADSAADRSLKPAAVAVCCSSFEARQQQQQQQSYVICKADRLEFSWISAVDAVAVDAVYVGFFAVLLLLLQPGWCVSSFGWMYVECMIVRERKRRTASSAMQQLYIRTAERTVVVTHVQPAQRSYIRWCGGAADAHRVVPFGLEINGIPSIGIHYVYRKRNLCV